MRLRDTLGLKFPDEYIVRFFFKESLPSRSGTVLELGCSNGNNLMLFYEYGFDVTGVDIGKEAIDRAHHNFDARGSEFRNRFRFIQQDMQAYLELDENAYDVVLLPSSLYYLPEAGVESVLKQVRRNLHPGSIFFLRMRTPEDYRFGNGTRVSQRSWRLQTSVTGERDSVITFYSVTEFSAMLSELWKPTRTVWCTCRFENPQGGVMVPNDDFVVWGEI